MESRLDARIAEMETDMAKRETRMLLAIAVLIALATTILGLWLRGSLASKIASFAGDQLRPVVSLAI